MANWKPGVADLSTDSTTLSTTAVEVRGYYVNTALSAHACNISNGSTVIFIIPASTAAGTLVEFTGIEGVLFDDNLIVDPDNSATGNITVMYRDRTQ